MGVVKENVKPLKRGRDINLLNKALQSQTDNSLKKSLRDTRRKLIKAIDEYNEEHLLKPWIDKHISGFDMAPPASALMPGVTASGILRHCPSSFF